jgi:ribosome biogenesis protein MAK21
LLHADVTDEYLVVWYFEDWLKKYFFSILHILEASLLVVLLSCSHFTVPQTLSLDPLSYIRTQTITLLFTLLRDKPEQEQNLLRLLVNKLGDTEKSLCSRASYHILQLLQTHPSMKTVVVREITALVLKPSVAASTIPTSGPQQTTHIRFTDKKARTSGEKDKKGGNPHARYYAAVTFNQVVLTPSDRDVAVMLLDIYFLMFKEILGEKGEGEHEGEEDDRSEDGEAAIVKTDKKGRVLDHKKGTKRKGETSSHSKGAAGFVEVEDSNSKLISAILTGINRALPFANIDADDSV